MRPLGFGAMGTWHESGAPAVQGSGADGLQHDAPEMTRFVYPVSLGRPTFR